MDITAATKMANELMGQHLSSDWRFVLDNARTRGGECNGMKHTISMSRNLIPLWSEEDVRETLLHEIGHALAGTREGHNHAWKAAVRSIGGHPSRTHDKEVVQGRWKFVCPNGHAHYKHRRPAYNRRPSSCAKCSPVFDSRYLFRVEDTLTAA